MSLPLSDKSLWVLILSNIVSIAMAMIQDWSIHEILWVYWGQSVIIGIINVIRMLSLKEFSTKNFKSNGSRPPENESTKKSTAAFFALHYGFFHFGYFMFLQEAQPLENMNFDQLIFLLVLVFGFLGTHGFSYTYNLDKDFKHKKPNIGTLFFHPYIRIIPMHLIIIIGTQMNSSAALILFMVLKTIADTGMHVIEHKLFQKKI